jgi:uncharacterized membrane protein (DUF4010 family)
VHALELWMGSKGLYLLSAISGIADVDAISLGLARRAEQGLDLEVAARCIVVAAIANSLGKAALALYIARGPMGLRMLLGLLAASTVGAAALMLV